MSRHAKFPRAPGLPALLRSALSLPALFLAAVLASTASTAHAAPINYSESVSGDLPETTPPAVFTLDVGVNTVSGTCGVTPSGNDFDSFAFIVPATMQITSGNVVLTDASGEFISSSWALRSGSVVSTEGTLVGNLTCPSPGTVNYPGTPLGPDSYNMWNGTFTSLGGPGTGKYTFTMIVIPEPATLSLLTLATAALRSRRR